MSVAARVCAHVKRGVCPKCSSPLTARRSSHNPGGDGEMAVKLLKAGVTAVVAFKRRKKNRNTRRPDSR